jgi:hypothetical protein
MRSRGTEGGCDVARPVRGVHNGYIDDTVVGEELGTSRSFDNPHTCSTLGFKGLERPAVVLAVPITAANDGPIHPGRSGPQ